jgi:aromatic ring hydroxylase
MVFLAVVSAEKDKLFTVIFIVFSNQEGLCLLCRDQHGEDWTTHNWGRPLRLHPASTDVAQRK